jgi:hypothetical protein
MQGETSPSGERVGRIVGVIAAIIIFEFVLAPRLFSSPGQGFNVFQFLCAGLAGGAGAMIGGFFGRAFAKP